ncbi:putative pectinesterase 53 [Acorus calamus]|uniref:Pectinesterase n=1 Tax=Acorus calamus TaxID=4465 RepID=A0AAV9EWZ7_ACOCL|nr:putative pectinesterase 53 [Acorus calamus]
MGALDAKLKKAEQMKMRVTVSLDGDGDYATIREALDSIPNSNTRRVVLLIKPGVYREKIVIPKSKRFITFLGDRESAPVITGNDTASTKGPDGKSYSTFHSATVAVHADYFVAINIVFENTAPYPEEGKPGGQAVALRVSGNKNAFYNCSFYGTQDTLYDHKGLHYFKNSFIQGSVDFIFGNGRSLYKNCTLNSIAKKVGFVTAQKQSSASIATGFSFLNSNIEGTGTVYLGRAWGELSRVVFSYTFMDKVVPQGWSNWHAKHPERSVYYGEYKCSGPGANWTSRVSWPHMLSDQEAQPFLGTYFVYGDGWILTPSSFE